MSGISNNYRERLARMAGGGGDAKSSSSSSTAVATATARTQRSRGTRSETITRTISNEEYKQMRSDMTGSSAVSTRSDAAALQNDLAQRYNLQNAIRPTQKRRAPRDHSSRHNHSHGESKSAGSTSSASSRPPPPRQCDCCQAPNPHHVSVCEACGYFLAGSQQIPLTMAQSRGLVAAPRPPAVEPLQTFEWESIEKGLAARQDAYCPICMEGFNRGFEVLLSCSHMYHRSCLQSFEKFMKTAERSCPICRTTNYQKKITHAGTKAYELVCAVIIQKNWRGYWCRSMYYDELKRFYKTNGGVSTSSCKKKFYEKELSSYTNKLAKEGDSMESEVNSLFSTSDKVMQENRDLDLAFELMMMERHNFGGLTEFSTQVEGRSALGHEGLDMQAPQKEEDTELGQNRNRRVVLLSCSHMFHQQCIMMLEDFVKNAEDCPLCPMCRCPFERKLLSRDCNCFDDAPLSAIAR